MTVSSLAVTDPFAELVGQVEAKARLKLASSNPVHAYLFLGQRGSGSFKAALAFAALILGADSVEAGDEVAAERHYRLSLELKHPDLVIVEQQGSALRVSEAAEVVRSAMRSPSEGRRKVIVVPGIDSIEEAAVGKLLKVIEEPPSSTVFLLLADVLIPELTTIASRCVPVEFGPLSVGELSDVLLAEGVTQDRALAAATAAGGDLDRARLLATDDSLAGRVELWESIPDRLDGTGGVVFQVVSQIQEYLAYAQVPLVGKHGKELEELAARVERLGERGSGRADLVARHKREVRRLRTDELRFGLAVLSRKYRDRLLAEVEGAEEGIAVIQDAAESLVRNPNEPLLLQALLVRLYHRSG